jgi:hypothetical protein
VIPFIERLGKAKRILVSGCGGGFDVFAGIPIAQHLLAGGHEVVLANYSFTNLPLCGGEQVTPTTWRVDRQANDLPYFPERWLGEWLAARGTAVPIYAFGKTGVRPLQSAYRVILDSHQIDLVLLVDGGTDSILFGDEPGLGTVAEDAVSTIAACAAAEVPVLLAAIGFGIDDHHGVSHRAFLENAAQVTRDGGFLGSFGLVRGTKAADAFLDLVDYANRRQPLHQSIVCNSIAGALRGEFGDYHATGRTGGSELFINPLMTQYWTFEAAYIVRRMAYAAELGQTDRIDEAYAVIERRRDAMVVRPRKPLPL